MTPKPITAIGNRYNRSFVNRNEGLMVPLFLMNWKVLFEENNHGKRGHPYRTSRTPNASITFLAKIRAKYSIPFRYTSIFRRIRKIVPDPRTKWNRKSRRRPKLHAVISINDVSVMSFGGT